MTLHGVLFDRFATGSDELESVALDLSGLAQWASAETGKRTLYTFVGQTGP